MSGFKSEIIEVTDKNKSLLARSKRFTTALSNVCFDTYNCGEGCLLEEKLKSFTERSAKRLLNKKGSGSGKTDLRQLTALTEYGCMTQLATLDSYLDVFAMNDDYYAASHKFVTLMAQQAVKRSYDVILCPAILFGNTLYRRTQLKTVEGLSTRPTTDRIKETLFNMIAPYLYDCVFLDLFAGSGAIGIEALSRGAMEAVFVEQDRKCGAGRWTSRSSCGWVSVRHPVCSRRRCVNCLPACLYGVAHSRTHDSVAPPVPYPVSE